MMTSCKYGLKFVTSITEIQRASSWKQEISNIDVIFGVFAAAAVGSIILSSFLPPLSRSPSPLVSPLIHWVSVSALVLHKSRNSLSSALSGWCLFNPLLPVVCWWLSHTERLFSPVVDIFISAALMKKSTPASLQSFFKSCFYTSASPPTLLLSIKQREGVMEVTADCDLSFHHYTLPLFSFFFSLYHQLLLTLSSPRSPPFFSFPLLICVSVHF